MGDLSTTSDMSVKLALIDYLVDSQIAAEVGFAGSCLAGIAQFTRMYNPLLVTADVDHYQQVEYQNLRCL